MEATEQPFPNSLAAEPNAVQGEQPFLRSRSMRLASSSSTVGIRTTVATPRTSDFGGYVSDASGATVSCPATLTVSNSCPPGQVMVNGSCTQQCPPGFTYRNGECTFIGCPLGYLRQGDKCVFSACPAGYYKDGDACVRANECTTPPKCVGDDLVNSCNNDTISTCDWGCAGGVSNPVPAPSGTIYASPKLLHTGNTSIISWSAANVRACTVTGTNGDAWTGKSSAGKTSKAIQMQTTYYLRCDGYSGSSPASIDKNVVVSVIPGWMSSR
jgi:hypothetical protein